MLTFDLSQRGLSCAGHYWCPSPGFGCSTACDSPEATPALERKTVVQVVVGEADDGGGHHQNVLKNIGLLGSKSVLPP